MPEESWWSFSYSPVFDQGYVAGMVCITGETTGRVLAERERDAADERLQLALSSGYNIGIWDWDIPADRLKSDARLKATLINLNRLSLSLTKSHEVKPV